MPFWLRNPSDSLAESAQLERYDQTATFKARFQYFRHISIKLTHDLRSLSYRTYFSLEFIADNILMGYVHIRAYFYFRHEIYGCISNQIFFASCQLLTTPFVIVGNRCVQQLDILCRNTCAILYFSQTPNYIIFSCKI